MIKDELQEIEDKLKTKYRFTCFSCAKNDPTSCTYTSNMNAYINKKTKEIHCTYCVTMMSKKERDKLEEIEFVYDREGEHELYASCDKCLMSGEDVFEVKGKFLCNDCFANEETIVSPEYFKAVKYVPPDYDKMEKEMQKRMVSLQKKEVLECLEIINELNSKDLKKCLKFFNFLKEIKEIENEE